MATVINDSGKTRDPVGGIETVIGLIILVVVLYLLFVYGLPGLRQGTSNAPQVNVPGRINVNGQQK